MEAWTFVIRSAAAGPSGTLSLSQKGDSMASQLTRSRSDRILGGVCGGLGEFTGVDATVFRVLFALLAVAPGVGLPLYLVLWLLLPEGVPAQPQRSWDEQARVGAEEIAHRTRQLVSRITVRSSSARPLTTFVVGLGLIVLGAAFLLRNLGITWFQWITGVWVWPTLMILLGLAILWRWLHDRMR
jgi:phage shock protein C